MKYTVTIDSVDGNTYKFIRLPKYKYVKGQPVTYEYSVVEAVDSVYAKDGLLVPAYEIHENEKHGVYKELHFTNYFNTTDTKIIPVTPEKKNTITIRTNTDEHVDVTLKMLDYIVAGTPDDMIRIDGPGYNGLEYNVPADKTGDIIHNILSGKYEIYVNENQFQLKDIIIEENTDNITVTKENDIYYLIIKDVPKDSVGTIIINLEKRLEYFQDKNNISNYFSIK